MVVDVGFHKSKRGFSVWL